MRNIDYSLLFKFNFIFSAILFTSFIWFNDGYDILSFALILFATISSAALLYIVLYVLLFIFQFTDKFILYLGGLVFSFVNLALIIDFFVFRLYQFHINSMVINILTSFDALRSIGIGTAPIVLFGFLVLFLLSIQLYIIIKLNKLSYIQKDKLNQDFNKRFLSVLLMIILIEKISYGFASLNNKNDLLSKFNVIPLYQPLTFNRFAYKYFGYKPDPIPQNSINIKSKLNYPLKPLQLDANATKFSIFIFGFDAARASIINEQTAPNIMKFKKDSIEFANHYSGGNATRFGIFSLMYGLNSTYWFSFLDASKGSVLFDLLKELDYNIFIISSTNTSWPEFRKTCYINILDSIYDKHNGASWQKDLQSSNEFIKNIKDINNTKPIFSFVFLDAPHGYSFSPEFNKFHSNSSGINYLKVTKNSQEIKDAYNRYKNAVYYDDYLFGKMIKTLKEKKLYDNSMIIFTSDHGQEFYEYGFFGHNCSFDEAQLHTPFIVKLPKQLQDIYKQKKYTNLTSHIDLVPTILTLLGVKNNPSDYSNGYNLFDKNHKRDFVFSANWSNNAIVTDKFTYVFSNMPNKIFKNQIRDTKSYKILENQKPNSKLILKVINQNKRFFKQ